MLQIYHNSRCGKSRNCVALFQNSKKEYEITEYLKNPPSVETLQAILQKGNFTPMEIIRVNEKFWKENFENQEFSTEELLEILHQNPILLQRPLVVTTNKAFIARENGDWQQLLI